MGRLSKRQKAELAANNTIKHNLEFGCRYELTLRDFTPDGIGTIVEMVGTRRITFNLRKSIATYVGSDRPDNDGFMMAMFKFDELPWIEGPNLHCINGIQYRCLATTNPVLIPEPKSF